MEESQANNIRKQDITYARKWLKNHLEDEKLIAFITRVKKSDMDELGRISVIREFLKANYSPHMATDLIAGLAYWTMEN